MASSAEASKWHRIIRASVRECLETWTLQAQAEPLTVEALEAILARAAVPILRQVEGRQAELVIALLPSLVPHYAYGVRGGAGRAAAGEGVRLGLTDASQWVQRIGSPWKGGPWMKTVPTVLVAVGGAIARDAAGTPRGRSRTRRR